MKYYIEINLLPDAEIPIYFLWEKVYQQIHLALVENKNGGGKVNIGVAFPNYEAKQNNLGSRLRLFAASTSDLEGLNIPKWLSRLKDYVHIKAIKNVPGNIKTHAVFKRIQTKSSNQRLARRKAKREGIALEKAQSILEKRSEQFSNAPYIQMKSQSAGKRYRLMIGCEQTEQKSSNVGFSTYGLSSENSVPMF